MSLNTEVKAMVLSAISAAADFLLSSPPLPLWKECNISAAIDEEDSDDELELLLAEMENPPSKKRKIEDYLSVVVPNYLDDDFPTHYRLRRQTVEFLLEEVGPDFKKENNIGRPRLDALHIVLFSLWVISNQESFRGVCERFNVGKGHGYQMFVLFCDIISNKISDFIYWPRDEEMVANRAEFEALRSVPFPGVVGCVDGTYIPIKGKKSEQQSYCTRKKFRAVILQGICDSHSRFIDVFAGWPGSSHDSRVWRNSPIYQQLQNNSNHLIPSDCHLLGDSAYPLDNYLMVPYRDNGFLTVKQKYFNRKLSSYRSLIEQSFGLLKSRFRRLKYLDMIRMDRVTKVVITACILHNICIIQSDDFNDVESDENLVSSNENPPNEYTAIGVQKRDNLADHIFQQGTTQY